MLIILLIGFLLILGISLMVLDAAIEHAEEGYEDQQGFHQKSLNWTNGTVTSEVGINGWDQTEGACCPLDMTPAFRPAVTPPFAPNT